MIDTNTARERAASMLTHVEDGGKLTLPALRELVRIALRLADELDHVTTLAETLVPPSAQIVGRLRPGRLIRIR